MSDFANMLKFFRERDGLSQRELAKKLGFSASAIGMYESGKRRPKYEDLETVADYFNTDINTLLGIRNYEIIGNDSVIKMVEICRRLPNELQKELLSYAKFLEQKNSPL